MIELPEGCWWDWDILHFDRSQLRLAAGTDLSYHHELEVVFNDVDFLPCPTQFHDPCFRPPTLDECALVRQYSGDDPKMIVAFDVEAPAGATPLPCVIAAESVTVTSGLVYRYWRENLQPGERLAPHVRPPSA